MMRKIYDLTCSNYGTVSKHTYDFAILPWGATEPHNLHLPYMTDCILSHEVAVSAAELAFERHGVRCMVLPPVNFGSQNPGQQDLTFCIHSRYETQKCILEDIVYSLERQGISKLLIINGHGGNTFKNMIRDMYCSHPDFLIASSEWYKVCKAGEYFDEAGDGKSGGFAPKMLREGKVWIPRNWSKVSIDTGIGNPAKATAEKGEAFFKAVVSEYADFLKDFTGEDLYI